MPDLTRRQIALVIGAALAVLTLTVGLYGLITGPGSPKSDQTVGQVTVRAAEPGTGTVVAPEDPSQAAIPRTTDAITFTRAIASAVFDWDTTTGYLPSDYQAPVLAESDPSGEETPGLINDLATYMPTVEQWLSLSTMNVTQTITIESAEVPATWPSVMAQAHGELRPGTTAVTITGTRTRHGIWNGETSSRASTVSFTVFVACPPAFDRCRVLRLSQLDNPLR